MNFGRFLSGQWSRNCGGMLVAVLASATLLAEAQTPMSNLVFTVGTTIRYGSQDWSFVVIGSQDPALLSGRSFAVYAKPGYATNSAGFLSRGSIVAQTDSGAIAAVLNQSLALGQNLVSLSNTLNVVLRQVSGAESLSLAQKVATANQLATADPSMRQTLSLVSRNNPGLSLCDGQAFAEVIAGVTTYEIREINPGSGSPADIIGRVTITPGAPLVLPGPGFPFQISSNTPADHLRIRLRWGTPPELRRLSLLSYGFNVWRMPRAVAEQLGFDATPPTLSQLYANSIRANDAPVLATKDFSALSGIGGADDLTDSTTYFVADDNGHKYGLAAFSDGAQFYYFVTARDLLGRDGLVSPGRLATACRQITPSAPSRLQVRNAVQAATFSGGVTNTQLLLLSWNQDTNDTDAVSEYWVYRWDNPSMALTNDAAPLDHRVAVVPQLPGTNVNRYLDNGADAPLTPGVTNYWFTVRAVSQAACGPLLSPQSAPMWGVLRERTAPDAASGEVIGSCGTPVVMFQNSNILTNLANTNILVWNYRASCQRRDRSIAWVQFTVQGENPATFGPVYFPPDGDSVSADFSHAADTNAAASVTCIVGTVYGAVSQPAAYNFSGGVATNTIAEAVFYSGQLLATALNSADPLLLALNSNQQSCSETLNVTRYPDGTVSMQFAAGGFTGQPRMVQVSSNATWVDVGVAWPDTNFVYWISYPACLLGPLPTFRGCTVNLPEAVGCGQHIARGADNGPVAPIHVRFRLTPRTREYRLYRRIDSGALSLISQGAAQYDSMNPGRTLVVTDDAMPPSAAQLCYFVQTLDEHGNGSPLSFLGCKSVKPPALPRPVLAEPSVAGDINNPQVLLNWFCPTAGVHRFQIQIERADQPASGKPTGFFALKLLSVPNFNPFKYYAGLRLHTLDMSHFDEGYLTPPIGVKFGPGPQFSLAANVVPGVPYNISVGSVGEQDEPHLFSQVWQFTWLGTNQVNGVPWPARPLPAVTHFDETAGTNYRVAAVIQRGWTNNLDTRYPVGIRIGSLSNYSLLGQGLSMNVGAADLNGTNYFYYQPTTALEVDPTRFLFRRISANPQHNDQPLLPIVVYRQQVTNANFPKVSGSLIQVTPLIERLAWSFFPGINGALYIPPRTSVADTLIAAGNERIPFSDHWIPAYYVYLRDQQPLMVGATYQYFVMHMNDKHEIAEIISAGAVTIPSN